MNKACIVIPYYGRWPKYFNLFLDSIRGQPLDYLFVTDLDLPFFIPSNVRKLKLDFSKLKSLFEQRLKSSVNINSAYKLCDYKPCYGKIFEDYLTEYDYWGFGDIDLIIGDIGKELDFYNCKWDVFSGRASWVSGALCILRNKPILNNLYSNSQNFKKMVKDPHYVGFDECSCQFNDYLINKNDSFFAKKKNFTDLIMEAVHSGVLAVKFEDIYKESIPSQDFLIYSRKRIENKEGKEYPLYHFITEKKSAFFFFPNWKVIPHEYKIKKSGFYRIDQAYKNSVVSVWRKVYGLIKLGRRLYYRGLNRLNLLIKQ